MNQNNPEILLVGTGAVGSFYGGKLFQAGARVSTLCRSDYDIVKKNGISVQSIYGNFTYKPDEVIRTADEYSKKPDYIIVATKVLPEIDIVSMIKKTVHPGTSIVLMQNGIGIEKPVRSSFPDNEIISALAFICVSRNSPGNIDHQDYGRIVIGTYPSGISEKVELLCSLLKKSGVPCEIDTNITAARWKKLIWNAPFNPISVLAGGADTKSMMESEATFHLIEEVMKEVALLAEKTGTALSEDIIKKNLDDTRVMKPYKTSMLLDFENKRPLEVEAILGNALRIASEQGITVPHIESLYGLLILADLHNRAGT
ncbi:MAG TPA: 2-dehydropantoate 2-reductase [Spirochaetota bacterium]|nr:2-dehydropantoate 2-reductase [Spirochaetota bacterium]HPR49805.1 2-dehydropantoate 2-reductase [Spirochaetota bacterium]